MNPPECSTFQLLNTMKKNDKGNLNSYRYNKKTHATMKKKKNYFALFKTYSVSNQKNKLISYENIHALYIFEQSKFKKYLLTFLIYLFIFLIIVIYM